MKLMVVSYSKRVGKTLPLFSYKDNMLKDLVQKRISSDFSSKIARMQRLLLEGTSDEQAKLMSARSVRIPITSERGKRGEGVYL